MAYVPLLKNLIAGVLKYKADLNIKFKWVCVTMCPLVISPFSCDLLKMLIEVFTVF